MAAKVYSGRELSAFCLQISILLKAAVPLDEGLYLMAEDAPTEEEKKLLHTMGEDVELGDPFFESLERTGAFPPYVVRMAKLGQQSGTLDQMMESLADYYEKEYYMMKNIRNAITYPVMMVGMLLIVLFVLFTRVMPVFEQVYAQLGVQMSPLSQAASRLGGILSGASPGCVCTSGSGSPDRGNCGRRRKRTDDCPQAYGTAETKQQDSAGSCRAAVSPQCLH